MKPKLPSLNLKSTSEYFLLYIFMAVVFLAPLSNGSSAPVNYLLITSALGFISIVWGILYFLGKIPVRIALEEFNIIALVMCCLIVFTVLQVMPGFMESKSWLIWHIAAEKLNLSIRPTISVDAEQTILQIIKLISYGLAFFLSMQLGRSQTLAIKIFKIVMLVSAFYAIHGLFIYFHEAKKSLLMGKGYNDPLSSTFLNRNHYATYCTISILVTVSLIYSQIIKNMDGSFMGSTLKNIFTKGIFYMILLAILLVSLFLTASRAGIASMLIGVASFMVMTLFIKDHSKKVLIVSISVILLLFFWLFSFSGHDVTSRMDTVGHETGRRMNVYHDIYNGAQDFILLGSGMGTFPDIFQAYRSTALASYGSATITHHNLYVAALMELGVIGSFNLFLLPLLISISLINGFITRKNGYSYPACGIAVTIAVATHSLFDWGMEVPATALLYCVIMGVCFAQSKPYRKTEVQ